MKTIKALIQRIGKFVTLNYCLPGGRAVSVCIPKDIRDEEFEELIQVLMLQIHDERAERGECSCSMSEEAMLECVN